MTELRIPAEVLAELNARTRSVTPSEWAQVLDRDGDRWDVTDITHEGEPVLLPWASDVPAAKRSVVEAAYGPLIDA